MRIITTTIFLSLLLSISTFSQLNMTFQGSISYDEDLSDIWGYVASDSAEYALVGVYNGVSIVDLSDPTNPVELFFMDGVNSIWRDIKTWGEYAYVTNETSNGVMVIDLSDLPLSASSSDWTPTITGLGTLSSIHNIYIDEFGYAYLAGSNLNSGGIVYVDVATTPGSPEYAGHGPAIYAHDVYVRDNKMYSSEIYAGHFSIYDVEDKENTLFLGSQSTEFNFTHNSWLSDDGTILFTTDELANATVGAYDVTNPSDIQELDQFVPYETLGDGVIPHNVHVWDDWLIISYYTDGCILVDGSNPSNLVEVGNFDTFIPESTGFSGAWGAYPFLPSGLVLVSDIGNGMYVLEPNYVRACWLEGNITRADNGNPIADASIEIVTTNVLDHSDLFGDYATGFATSGTYDVTVSKPGFQSETLSIALQNDSTSYLNVELIPLASFGFSGSVVDALSGDPIPNAKVLIRNGTFEFEMESNMDGSFMIDEFYEGDYEVFSGKWGYNTFVSENESLAESNNSIAIELIEGYEDIFALDLGWTSNNTGFTGDWERGVPIGIQPPGVPIYITPNLDVPEDAGNYCYVTGNISDVNGGVLVGGNAELISPSFDLTGYESPYLSFYTWFFNLNLNTQLPGTNEFQIKISNGISTETITSFSYDVFEEILWMFSEIDIASIIEPTSTMNVRFKANSNTNFTSASEAGVDYFKVWDAGITGVNEFPSNPINLIAYPNPSSDFFYINYKVNEEDINSNLEVYNSIGQKVEVYNLNASEGIVRIGENLEKGFYIIKLTNESSSEKTLKIIKN